MIRIDEEKSPKNDPAVQKIKSILNAKAFLLIIVAMSESYHIKPRENNRLTVLFAGQRFLEKFKHKALQSCRRINLC
jgi:hypothetical protein